MSMSLIRVARMGLHRPRRREIQNQGMLWRSTTYLTNRLNPVTNVK